MTPFPAALPTQLTQQLAANREDLPVKVFAQDETRLGLPPIIRRRMTARGGHPVATVWPRFDNFSLCGAVEPLPGDSFFRELPLLNSAMCQRWLDDFAHPFAASFNMLVLDHGAFHTAKALRWPPHVATVPFPSYSPELNPIERLWRDLKAQLANSVAKTLDTLSDTVCRVIQRYSQAALHSLTGFTSFVQAVQTALHTTNG